MKSDEPISRWRLSIAALGVVFGAIGTSPLYAMKACFSSEYGLAPDTTNVLGILSLFFWALTVLVSVRYLVLILRADNEGQGGIFSLLAMLSPFSVDGERSRARRLLLLGLLGAALLYSDGVLTPAITVLGAVEGLKVATPQLKTFVIPFTVGILAALFILQQRGTSDIARAFGPIMALWFLIIGALGIASISHHPSVLMAIDPRHAIQFLALHRGHGFMVLGAVVLCIAGGEMLFAEMGPFGRKAIARTWFALVFPSLILNYFGQGALLLEMPHRSAVVANPFFHLVPHFALSPMLALSITAAIIAAQSLLTATFSMTRQAVQLGFWPRVCIINTSENTEGEIYVPLINWALFLGSVALVLEFRSVTGLVAAYGIVVSGSMAITSVLFASMAPQRFRIKTWQARLGLAFFLGIDAAFLVANLIKIDNGGWIPLAITGGVYVTMTTWREGREAMTRLTQSSAFPIDLFLSDLSRNRLLRVPGTAVFMAEHTEGIPVVLLHHVKHCKSVHEQVILLSVVRDPMPIVSADKRMSVDNLGQGFFRLTWRHGFMESAHVPTAIREAVAARLIAPSSVSYYLGHDTLVTSGHGHMHSWRKVVFSMLQRNARSATEFFGLPPGRVVELGAQVEL